MFSHIKELFTRPSGYRISRSVRLRASASAYFNRTYGTPTDGKKWTLSVWLKRGLIGSASYQIMSAGAAVSDQFHISADSLSLYLGGAYRLVTTQVLRDPSAWYHIVLVIDTANATADNRNIMYINGVQVTAFSTRNNLSLNATTNLNSASVVTYLGRYAASSSEYTDGYLTEINFIDGQALTPSSFGSTNAVTGVWQPIKYTGTYGTNGFYLNFSDNSNNTATTIGKDYSGNGNNWTPNNISVTSGITYDSMVDSPTVSAVSSNYCVLNPLDKATSFTTADGNLSFTPANTSDLYSCRSTIQIPSTGKWIWQVTNTNSAYMITAGLLNGSTALTAQQTVSCAGMTVGAIGTFFSTTQWMNTTTAWSVTNIGNGDTLVIAYDADAGKIWFGRVASGGTTVTWYNTSGTADPSTGTDPRASGITAGGWFAGFGTYYTPSGASANFGQRPFAFTNIPTGFVALNTQNLPTPTISNGATVMAASTYTGTGATQSIVNSGNNTGAISFKPDLVWIKSRSAATNNNLFNSVRGTTNYLISNSTAAEATNANTLTAFGTNGFTLGSDAGSVGVNVNAATYVAWQWQAGQGSTSSNTSGSITSTVSVNATAGFSVVTYTGNGSTGTVGHGLGVTPSMVIVKNIASATDWAVWTPDIYLSQGTYLLYLDTTAAKTATSAWNNSNFASTYFPVGSSSLTNSNATNYVAFCWAAVKGYSAFGSYTGNGSADGPFVYTGFRPRWVMIKRTDANENWQMYDTSRNTSNVVGEYLLANSSGAGATITVLDFLSNGFKIRVDGTNPGVNTSGGTYIYAAFAENPFKLSLAR